MSEGESIVGQHRGRLAPALYPLAAAALTAALAIAPAAEARRVPMGAAVWWACADATFPRQGTPLVCPHEYDPLYAGTHQASFDWLTPENEFKMQFLTPARGVYDFSIADRIAAHARDNGKKIRGHALIWGLQTAKWLYEADWPVRLSRDEALALMRDHIHAVMGHFREKFPGVVSEWDVVNEAFATDGSMMTGHSNLWASRIGPDYIEKAFQYARQADPDARLFYNETGIERPGQRRDATLNMVRDFRTRGIPIDGVGIQGHVGINENAPNRSDIDALMATLAELDVDVAITEMDVSLPVAVTGPQAEAAQAAVYRTMARSCSESSNCTSFTTWGVGDTYSWLGKNERPLLFDSSLLAKPSYGQVTRILGRPRYSAIGREPLPRLSLRFLRCGVQTLRVAVEGADVRRIRSVQFSVGGRRYDRIGRAPFRDVLDVRLLRKRSVVRARVTLRKGQRLQLERPLRDCP